MAAPENKKSRQRVVRILKPVDDWLQRQARINRANKDNSLATEINRLLNNAYTDKTGNDPKTGEPI